jgi:hypothetical protein
MKVKDVIEALGKFDPEDDVVVPIGMDCSIVMRVDNAQYRDEDHSTRAYTGPGSIIRSLFRRVVLISPSEEPLP